MATEQTIKELQKRVDEAKKGLRSTMTVQELGKEHVRDIVSEVSETQAYISKLFDREDNKLGASSKILKDELEKLVEEGTEADAKRLNEIQKRAAAIAKVAREGGGKEGKYIGELADVLSGGAKKAGKLKLGAEMGVDDMVGAKFMKTIFGSKMTNFMWGADSAREAKTRQEAELRLLLAQANLDAETGDGDGTTSSGAEEAEERREDEREEKIKVKKQDKILELLEEILFRVGGKKESSVNLTDSERSSGGPAASATEEIGLLEDIKSVVIDTGVMLTTWTGLSFLGKKALSLIPGTKAFSTAAMAPKTVTGGGLDALIKSKVSRVGPLTKAQKTVNVAKGTSKILGKLAVPIAAGEKVFSDIIKNIETEAVQAAAGLDWMSGVDSKTGQVVSGQQFLDDGSRWDKYTGKQIARAPGQSDPNDWRDKQLKLDNNEAHMLIRLKNATEMYEKGGWHIPLFEMSRDEKANMILNKLQGDLWDRQKIVGSMRPQTIEEALKLFSVKQETYDLFQIHGKRLLDSISFYETKDKIEIEKAIHAMSLTAPNMNPELFLKTESLATGTPQRFFGENRWRNKIQTESMGRMGFESEQWNDIREKEGGFLGYGKYAPTAPKDWTPVDYGQSLREGLGIGKPNDIKNSKSIIPINAIDTNQQRKLDLPGPGRGHQGSMQPQAMLMQNNQNEFRNTVVAGQLLEDQNSIGIGNQARNNLYNEANYSLT
jgi:hypothetical protein